VAAIVELAPAQAAALDLLQAQRSYERGRRALIEDDEAAFQAVVSSSEDDFRGIDLSVAVVRRLLKDLFCDFLK